MNWITFIAPYCENCTSRALYKYCTKDTPNKYVFNCRLNESSVGINLMLSGRLFQAVCPFTQKARSPNLVQCDHLGTASLMPDVDADRSEDRLSLMTSYIEEFISTDYNVLQSDINKVDEWTRLWLLKLNPDKCKCMTLSINNKTHNRKYF